MFVGRLLYMMLLMLKLCVVYFIWVGLYCCMVRLVMFFIVLLRLCMFWLFMCWWVIMLID